MQHYRQGDVLIEAVARIPGMARPLTHLTLAAGEVTGHAHRVEPRPGASAHLFAADGSLFLRISGGGADVVHEEHHRISLEDGAYRSWRQREYVPPAARRFVGGVDSIHVMD